MDTYEHDDRPERVPGPRRSVQAGNAAWPEGAGLSVPPPGWIALPIGRREDGPTIPELVAAVRAAGGTVGGDALFDPRYEPEMRQFLIRALELEGIPIPRGGGRP